MSLLIVITNPVKIENEIETINSLFNAGLQYLHLRKPELSENEVSNLIQQIEKKYRNKIIVHSFYNLAYDYELKGIHLTNDFINNNSHDDILKTTEKAYSNNLTVSTSAHSFNELKQINYNFEYVFLSPVFDSISKIGYKSNFDFDETKQFLSDKNFNFKIIALGGIINNNVVQLLDIGFDGVALLGAIWKKKKNALIDFNSIKNIIFQHQKSEIKNQ